MVWKLIFQTLEENLIASEMKQLENEKEIYKLERKIAK